MGINRREFLRKALLRSDALSPDLAWFSAVKRFVAASDAKAGHFLLLPEYRPDLVERMSIGLEISLFDFRAEVMSARAWQAHTISLAALQECLSARAEKAPIIAFNVDALLATKSREERGQWYEVFLKAAYLHRIIVVLTIYAEEVGGDSSRILRCCAGDLPEHGILHRMHELKEETMRRPMAPQVLVID